MTGQELKRLRQRAIRELVVSRPVSSQRELVDALTEQGFAVTQATVSRDIADLGLMKAPRADGHVYVSREDLVPTATVASNERLQRILSDIPVTIGRSVIAQAIDESTLQEQEGTLAGDNTLLVLFADEARLERWRARFEAIGAGASPSSIAEVPYS